MFPRAERIGPYPISKKVLEFFENALKVAHARITRFKLDSDSALHLHAVLLYSSILELSSSLVALYRTDNVSAIPIILKRIIEAHVDLQNLCNDSTYAYSLQVSSIKENLRFFNSIKRNGTVYGSIVSKAFEVGKIIDEYTEEIIEIQSMGHNERQRYDCFSMAGLPYEFKQAYSRLCCDSHNDFNTLRKRQINLANHSGSSDAYKEPDSETLENYFGIASELLVRSSYAIHALLKIESGGELARLKAELDGVLGVGARGEATPDYQRATQPRR